MSIIAPGCSLGVAGAGCLLPPQLYSFPHRTFLQYLAGCYLVSGRRRDVLAAFKERLALGSDWYVAAQMGAEALLFERLNDEGFLDLAYSLCPPESPQTEADWRGVVWSGHMARLLTNGRSRKMMWPAAVAAICERLRPRLRRRWRMHR